mmetsp:Transcript_16383/g.46430  ORF Transcript_16383/g.46430 Transcript_16383/m.46430 type:complete len:235 (-) Transcript_16383:313-1017(-)
MHTARLAIFGKRLRVQRRVAERVAGIRREHGAFRASHLAAGHPQASGTERHRALEQIALRVAVRSRPVVVRRVRTARQRERPAVERGVGQAAIINEDVLLVTGVAAEQLQRPPERGGLTRRRTPQALPQRPRVAPRGRRDTSDLLRRLEQRDPAAALQELVCRRDAHHSAAYYGHVQRPRRARRAEHPGAAPPAQAERRPPHRASRGGKSSPAVRINPSSPSPTATPTARRCTT